MYYLVYGFFYLLSLFPLWMLYILSDCVYGLLYYVFGYRKKVVMDNLAIAFPEKTEAERKKIAKAFYHNFVDNFIETLKLLSASSAFFKKHFVLENPEVYEQYYSQDRKCQLHLGHNFNWELASITVPFYTAYTFIAVYMPIENKIFERLLKHLRSRTGTIMLPATSMSKSILPYREKRYLLALVADQAPGDPSKAYWLNFFGRPTPIVRGPERGASAGNIPAVFAEIHKVKRGYYSARLELGDENPRLLPEGELTRRYIGFLERSIKQYPAMWLWSHRRWKHGWKEEYKEQWIDLVPPPPAD
ncbi:MAG TPA: lysophospholipid acyltransferase family protein [Puia sp.]|nr:lysophospholipid acyltransferase family protein [Puia sp.]